MVEDYFKTTCPCCGQPLEMFIETDGHIAIRFYDINDQAEIVEILKKSNVELGANLCGKEDE